MGCMGLEVLAGSLLTMSSAVDKDLGRVNSVACWCNIPLVDTGVTSQEFGLVQQLVSGHTFLGKCPHMVSLLLSV